MLRQVMRCAVCCTLSALIIGATARAQAPAMPDPAANPISAVTARGYNSAKGYVLKAADEMPEANYSWRPTPQVRTYGELLGHVAAGEYLFCSAAKGEPNPKGDDAPHGPTDKASIASQLQAAFAYCDAVYAASRDGALTDSVSMFGHKTIRFAALAGNVGHLNEHYGNIVVYLRLKNLVPPSSMKK